LTWKLYVIEEQDNAEGFESNDSSGGILTTRFQSSFEIDLGTSRVFRRTQWYQPDTSFTSSAVRTRVWFIFSGLSLSDVCKISAIALPVYSEDILNNQWSKFIFSNTGCPSDAEALPRSSVSVRPPVNSPESGSATGDPGNWTVTSFPTSFLDLPSSIPNDIGQDLNKMMVYKLVVLGDRCVETGVLINKAGYSPLRFS
jgi:hypothetical protein